MKYRSTRGKAPVLSFSEAILAGLASDGGLYVPEQWPINVAESLPKGASLVEVAQRLLSPFVAGDPLETELSGICSRAFDFPIPLKTLRDETAVLELFHGPTAAFKDVGARFLAECLERIARKEGCSGGAPSRRTVLVATSGDTGGAVAGAFHGKTGIDVVILYPKGKISWRQEKQLTAWGDNVRAFAVHGDFDDCQRMVKEAFLNPDWRKERALISANSINLGRILPQMVYYAWASREYQARTGRSAGFIIPSGNLGNSLAAVWARKVGFPIREITLALNANRGVEQFLASPFEEWKAPATVATLANAMDVGNPSNLERLLHLFPEGAELRGQVSAVSVSDEEIRAVISRGPEEWGEIWCPHTATAVFVRETKRRTPDWILVATAHPAKFESIVEPLIGGRAVDVPPALDRILSQPSRITEIDADLPSLQQVILSEAALAATTRSRTLRS